MSREVRRVPADWVHPRNNRGRYVPLHGGSFKTKLADWLEGERMWNSGLVWDYKNQDWRPKPAEYTFTWEDWDGEIPDATEYMPDWPESERTHYQMYETTTEGKPISPVFATPEELAHWLADNHANSFCDMTETYETWLSMIVGPGYSMASMVMVDGHAMSGVKAAAVKK